MAYPEKTGTDEMNFNQTNGSQQRLDVSFCGYEYYNTVAIKTIVVVSIVTASISQYMVNTMYSALSLYPFFFLHRPHEKHFKSRS